MHSRYREQGSIAFIRRDGARIACPLCLERVPDARFLEDEIHEFCTLNYNTTFPQMHKSDVNGEKQLPLYAFLKSQQGFKGFGEGKMADILRNHLGKNNPDYEKNDDIKWNFTKFVIDRTGKVVARFEPTADMAAVEAFIADLLKN